MNSTIYIEGGGDSKDLHVRCREGFRRLLESAGFKTRMPRLVACGGRSSAFADFKSAHENNTQKYIAMLIDSERPIRDHERAWEHLRTFENWEKPVGAEDKQVLFMTTCMESWIVADIESLKTHYGSELQENALPSHVDLENRERGTIQDKLEHATRNCANHYKKGRRSFEILGKINPDILEKNLESFKRVKRILNDML